MHKAALANQAARAARAAREASTPVTGTQTITYDARDYPPGLVGVPTVDWMYSESAQALMNLRGALPPGSEMRFMPQTGSSIALKRTMCVEFLLATPAPEHNIPRLEWLLQCDSDMVPPMATALRLLSHNLDIVAGYYVARQPPYKPCLELADERGNPTYEPLVDTLHPVRVTGVGFGCVLVRRHVFEKMGSPWFEHARRPGWGEDDFFCDRAVAAGFKIHVDPQLEIGHLGVTAITPAFGRAWSATPEARKFRELQIATERANGNVREEYVEDYIAGRPPGSTSPRG
jgi:hypothetical protein